MPPLSFSSAQQQLPNRGLSLQPGAPKLALLPGTTMLMQPLAGLGGRKDGRPEEDEDDSMVPDEILEDWKATAGNGVVSVNAANSASTPTDTAPPLAVRQEEHAIESPSPPQEVAASTQDPSVAREYFRVH